MTQSYHKITEFKNIITYPIFLFVLLKFATMNVQTWKNMKKLEVYLIKSHSILSWAVDICIPF